MDMFRARPTWTNLRLIAHLAVRAVAIGSAGIRGQVNMEGLAARSLRGTERPKEIISETK